MYFFKNLAFIAFITLISQWTNTMLQAQVTSADSIIYSYDFEVGQGLWQVSNGLWTVGTDTTLPASVTRAGKIAGGILNSSVPGSAFDTYLISPPIVLPTTSVSEELRVAFLHWHEFNTHVSGNVYVRIDSGGGRYGSWESISVAYQYNLNLNYWKTASLIISKYASKRINIGFRLYGVTNMYGSPSGKGWRVDNVNVIKSSFRQYDLPTAWDFDQDWNTESSANSWWDAYDLFRIGSDNVIAAPSKPHFVGTNLKMTNIPYSDYTARMVSPCINIPVAGSFDDVNLRFRYYLNVNSHASATVAIAIDSGGGKLSAWNNLITYTTSTNWVRVPIIIPTVYQGKRIRLGFSLTGVTNMYGGPSGKGFYVDDVDLFLNSTTVGTPILVSPPNYTNNVRMNTIFSWRLVASAFNYRIQISKDPHFTTTIFDSSNIDPTAYTFKQNFPDTINPYYWRVQATNGSGSGPWSDVWTFNSGTTAVEDINNLTPNTFTLNQNYPNPFNPVTTIIYQLPEVGKVSLKIYDILGQEVKSLIDEVQKPGYKAVEWNSTNNLGQNVASGIYFYRLEAGIFSETKKLILIK